MFLNLIDKIPLGYSTGIYQGKKYGISKQAFNNGLSFKVFAEELAGNDFVSLNFYKTTTKELLKPCEMPEAKVLSFLKEVILVE